MDPPEELNVYTSASPVQIKVLGELVTGEDRGLKDVILQPGPLGGDRPGTLPQHTAAK